MADDRVRVHDAATGVELPVENLRPAACPPCPESLPSSTATRALLNGEPDGLARVGWAVVGRAALIGAGIAVKRRKRLRKKGGKALREIVFDALAGSLAIQASVVGFEAANMAAARRRGGGGSR